MFRVIYLVRLLVLLLFFSGCTHTYNPQPIDTIFKERDKNWSLIYEKELKIALENEDMEAFYFFWPEYLKELSKNKCKKFNELHTISCDC